MSRVFAVLSISPSQIKNRVLRGLMEVPHKDPRTGLPPERTCHFATRAAAVSLQLQPCESHLSIPAEATLFLSNPQAAPEHWRCWASPFPSTWGSSNRRLVLPRPRLAESCQTCITDPGSPYPTRLPPPFSFTGVTPINLLHSDSICFLEYPK